MHHQSSRSGRALAASVLALAALASTASAQQAAPDSVRDSTALGPVVVTATRLAVPQAAPTATATVLTGAELRARGITHVLDALRDVPAAAVLQSGSFGSQTSLFLRGGESKYAQVLVDGVPVNDPGGAFNFANLTVDNVERVEILRGPASVLYGSDAVSGVVQVFTRRGAGRPRASLSARGGSFGTAEAELSASGGAGEYGWSIGGARFGNDGILPFNNDYSNRSASGSLRWGRDGTGDVTVSARAQRAQFNFPTNSSGTPEDSNAFRRDERATLGVDAGAFLSSRLEARVQLGLAGIRGRNDDRPDSPADTLGFSQGFVSWTGTTRRDADARVNYYLSPKTVLTVGGDYRGTAYRSADSTITTTGANAGAPFSPHRDNRAVYAQFLGDVRDVLSLTIGARYDDNSAFGPFRTVRAGAGLKLGTGTLLRASAGNAFREPTMNENFAQSPFELGNPALRPERTRTVEAGVEQALAGGRVVLAGTWYLQRFHDMIQYVSPAETVDGTETNYLNVAGANAGGVELEARARSVAGFGLSASYTYLDTRVTDAGRQSGPGANFVVGERLLRRPQNLAALTVTRAFADRGSVAVRVNHTGERDDRDFVTFPATPVVLDAFTTVNLSAEVALLRPSQYRAGVTLTARAENLFDAHYEPILNFPAPGRAVVVGVRLDAR